LLVLIVHFATVFNFRYDFQIDAHMERFLLLHIEDRY